MTTERQHHGNRTRKRRDVRLRAIVITVALVLLAGSAVYMLPEQNGVNGKHAVSSTPASRFKPDAQFDKQFREAAILLHRKDYPQALQAWQALVKTAPQLPEAWVNFGYTLLGLNRHRAAEQAFQKAITQRSSQANAYYGLALALEGQDKYSDAAFNMQAFLERTPKTDPYVKKAREQIGTWMKWAAERESCEPEQTTSLKLVNNKSQAGRNR